VISLGIKGEGKNILGSAEADNIGIRQHSPTGFFHIHSETVGRRYAICECEGKSHRNLRTDRRGRAYAERRSRRSGGRAEIKRIWPHPIKSLLEVLKVMVEYSCRHTIPYKYTPQLRTAGIEWHSQTEKRIQRVY
jgi:hypothetical protein